MCKSKAEGGLRCVSNISKNISPQFERAFEELSYATTAVIRSGAPTTAWNEALENCRASLNDPAITPDVADATNAFLDNRESGILLRADRQFLKMAGLKQTPEFKESVLRNTLEGRQAQQGLSDALDRAANKTSASMSMQHFNIDPKFPYPQDLPLEKVPAVVQLIDNGDNTDTDLAWCLGQLSTQQGNYAGNAVCYLGLAERDHSMTPNVLSLTSAGEDFLNASPTDQKKILGHLVAQMSLDDLKAKGYSDNTEDHRARNLESWQKYASKNGAVGAISTATNQAIAASQSSARPTKITPVAINQPAPPPPVCPKHFIALPASGICDECN